MKDLVIRFASAKAARHFALWLCESGEQGYWQWMECREREEPGNITARAFHYHGPEDRTKARNDPRRYGEFLCDGVIRTTCGRVSE